METEILVKKAKHGDKDALVTLIMAEKEGYYKLAYVYMKNSEDAMDALEDMIVILYEKINHLKKEAAFYSWSKTILANCCKRTLKNKKKIVYMDAIAQEQVFPQDIQHIDLQFAIDDYLLQLNEKQQEAIKLRYYLDLDYETIAHIMKVPIGTVKSRVSIGLKKLKESLGDDDHE